MDRFEFPHSPHFLPATSSDVSYLPTASASRIASGCSLATGGNVFAAPLNFAGAAFQFADDGEGDAEHGGEVLLGEIEFGEGDLILQTIIFRILEALAFHGRSVFTQGLGVFRCFS